MSVTPSAFTIRAATCRPVFRCVAVAALAVAALCNPALAQDQPQLDLQRTRIAVGMFQIDAQVAATPKEREIGLMHRAEMPTHEGMLFVFDQPNVQCFWMKNTLLPLTAAFVDEDGTVANLADMQPQTTDSHCSTRPVRFVLEMNQGWFKKKGIKAGTKLKGSFFKKKS